MSKLGMVSSYHPHSMRERVERVTAKTGRTSCTNWTNSFGVSGFRTRTHLLHWHFIFLNLLQLQTFVAFCTHHSKWRHQFSILSDIICYFSVIYRFVFRAKWPWNWKSLQNELWKCRNLAWYHHFTHIACAKEYRGLRQKLDALRVQTGQSLSEYQGFGRELICYTDTSFF